MARYLFLLVLAGCSGSDEDTDLQPDTDPAEASCSELPDGLYSAEGSCFFISSGNLTAQLGMDLEACTFDLTEWSANFEGSAEGGTVDRDNVSLHGVTIVGAEGERDGCNGTIEGEVLSGRCADGCTWELTFRG